MKAKGQLPDYITPAQLDVWRALASGRQTKEIAMTEGVGYSTVTHHREGLYRVLKVNSLSALTLKAVEHGIIQTPPVRPLVEDVNNQYTRYLLPPLST